MRLSSDVGEQARETRAATWHELGEFVAATVERQTWAAGSEHGTAEIQTQTSGSGWAYGTHSFSDSNGGV